MVDAGEVFRRAGGSGWCHVRCIDCDRQCGHAATEPVVLASMVKVPLVLEFARQVVAGQLDPTARVRLRATDRLGGSGTAGCADHVEMSLRDLARFALSISDNTAADALFAAVGVANVRSLVREVGLPDTRILGGPRQVVESIVGDVSGADPARFAADYAGLDEARMRQLRALDPRHTNASTGRDLTALLRAVWRDEAAPAAACATLRGLMATQLAGHRLAAGFPDEVEVVAKTGTLLAVRAEAGVVSYPDGGRYAVAVGIRLDRMSGRQPAADRALGTVARRAVESLRADCRHPDLPPAVAPDRG
ncbi:serine hydrolase [Actinocatenispora thailandica]|uniref:Serine hydrolase n=1 Tax=Actinocatenispora thailandica TaxID=227318 RepID=A0A7R7HY60_9ACTN|nr:serine hydrolase [Actinocatenispora thailandica]BCJ36783.1 serine hydrolase [Actinocatenispora thailandica]